MRAIKLALIYLALFGGAILFAWPFLWMFATSAKLESELFSEHPRILPETPRVETRSPYIDNRLFADIRGPRMKEALAIIDAELRSTSYSWPNDVDVDQLRKQTARGIYARLLATLPAETWSNSAAELQVVIGQNISPQLVVDLTTKLRRAFCIGQLRARSYDLQEEQLVTSNWTVVGDAAFDAANAELRYDLSQHRVVRLSQIFHTSFPISRLHRLQLYVRNADTWHAVNLTIEKAGAQFQAEHAIDDADFNWTVYTWQERGPDDRPDKIKTWTLLRKIDNGPQFVAGPNELKVTIELRRRNLMQAWAAKILHNYRLTLDYIPFWRYVATSLFLVTLNVVGTVFSCSLVAYAFARLRWPGRSIAFALLLGTMMVPPQVTMIPQFLIFQKLGWYNTLRPLWVMSFFGSAFSIFLLRQFMKGIPRDLEDAARLDGCGFARIYWYIILPLIRPSLAVVAVFTFLATWNEFMLPLIYLSDQRLYPLSFGLYAFQIQALMPGTSAGIGMLMAGAILMMLPVIAMFFVAQRSFLQGMNWTGLKG
jgi:ABC-type glycerol-3-phosphate transport system permease component